MKIRNLAAVIAALVVALAFFLPWMNGSNEFAHRTFSGFDFARLVRNFEITAGSSSGLGQIRATAAALYFVPALAINAAFFNGVAVANGGSRRASGIASVISAAYALAAVASLLLLGVLPITGLADVIGWPSYGLAVTAVAGLVIGCLGVWQMISPGASIEAN